MGALAAATQGRPGVAPTPPPWAAIPSRTMGVWRRRVGGRGASSVRSWGLRTHTRRRWDRGEARPRSRRSHSFLHSHRRRVGRRRQVCGQRPPHRLQSKKGRDAACCTTASYVDLAGVNTLAPAPIPSRLCARSILLILDATRSNRPSTLMILLYREHPSRPISTADAHLITLSPATFYIATSIAASSFAHVVNPHSRLPTCRQTAI